MDQETKDTEIVVLADLILEIAAHSLAEGRRNDLDAIELMSIPQPAYCKPDFHRSDPGLLLASQRIATRFEAYIARTSESDIQYEFRMATVRAAFQGVQQTFIWAPEGLGPPPPSAA